jgi:hypothetical protein
MKSGETDAMRRRESLSHAVVELFVALFATLPESRSRSDLFAGTAGFLIWIFPDLQNERNGRH